MMDTLKVIDSFSSQAGIRPFVLIGSFLHVQQRAHSRSSAVVFMGWNGLICNHQQFHPAAFFMGINGPGPSAVSFIGNIRLICIHWQCFSLWEVVVDDFGYVCLDKGKRKLVNVIEGSKHNAETSHAQHFKQ